MSSTMQTLLAFMFLSASVIVVILCAMVYNLRQRLTMSKHVIRLMYGNWHHVRVYVTKDHEVWCDACSAGTKMTLPIGATDLGKLAIAVCDHYHQYHPVDKLHVNATYGKRKS